MSRNFTDLISGISIDFYITFKHNQSFKRKMDFTLNLLGQIFIQCNIFLNNLTNILDVTIQFHFIICITCTKYYKTILNLERSILHFYKHIYNFVYIKIILKVNFYSKLYSSWRLYIFIFDMALYVETIFSRVEDLQTTS